MAVSCRSVSPHFLFIYYNAHSGLFEQVGQLAMETLLSLTSKRAGEWFKEELRELGGLEHIVKTIRECHRHINNHNVLRSGWTEPLLDKLRKVDRCLRVLENVSARLSLPFWVIYSQLRERRTV